MSLSFIVCPPAIAGILSDSGNPNQMGCPDRMVLIPGGTFAIGTNEPIYPEERAAEDVTVDSFCMDSYEVTNAEFAKFVVATGYQTVAERPLPKAQFPDLSDEQRSPGSLVFQPPEEDVKTVEFLSWWQWRTGANWQHPEGPESTIQGKENHPVVHIAYEDAIAYATWAGKQLPTEAQWEYAAKGTRKNRIFPWGNDYSAKKANTWQGRFPFVNTQQDGYGGTAPVGTFPANDYGLYDMAGNVWEWTADWYAPTHDAKAHHVNPKGVTQQESFDPKKPTDGALHVIKGGSFLCAKNYCSRSRPAARESQATDTGTNHIGMRLVMKGDLTSAVIEPIIPNRLSTLFR
jgi:sulfatase modifying factor 1